jgi:hypothetical protein
MERGGAHPLPAVSSLLWSVGRAREVAYRPGSGFGEGQDGNDIEVEITNAPSGLCSSSLAAPFSERALYPKA